MSDEHLTRQDLIYIARALRVAAGVDDAKAADREFISSKTVFQKSAREQRTLAEKGRAHREAGAISGRRFIGIRGLARRYR
jgi:hypothetical protein